MSQTLKNWVEESVKPYRHKPMGWLSSTHFFRDPIRGVFVDSKLFFAPADGIILYQKEVKPDEAIVDIKGKSFSLRDAFLDEDFDSECLVVGIFMTFYDPHINRIPFGGRLRFKKLDALHTYNRPMLDVEKSILDDLQVKSPGDYLFHNERMLNSIYSMDLQNDYYVLQIADFDVDCICHFSLEQNRLVAQGDRFSMIRYGSQVDLVIPTSPYYHLELMQNVHDHVEAGVDALVRVERASKDADRA